MNTPPATPTRLGAGMIASALLSLGLSVAALVPLPATTALAGAVAGTNDYRLTVIALGLALLFAVIAIGGASRLPRGRIRWLSLIAASGGLLLSAYLLAGLIGTCGLGVLGGTCQP